MNRVLGQNGIATLTPGPSPSPPERERGADPLELIAAGRHSIEAVCRESKMSILELATQVCTAQNIEALGRVAQLHAMQREMLLGQLKRDALVRLAELTAEVPVASADETRAAEIMRKACVDLLRYGGSSFSSTAPQSHPPRDDAPEPINEEKILALLEQLGEEKIEYEPRAQASGSVEPPPPGMPSDMPSEALKDVHSSFDSISHNGPGARVSGSYLPPPPENVTTRTGKMPVPPESCKTTGGRNSGGEDCSRFEDGHPP